MIRNIFTDKKFIFLTSLMLVTAVANIIRDAAKKTGSQAYSFQYLADAAIFIGAFYLCYENYLLYKKGDEERDIYLILSSLVICIGTIHLLRMIYGGLLC